MGELDAYLELLGELYGATVDPVVWPLVLARIRGMYDGTGIDLFPAEQYAADTPAFISGRLPGREVRERDEEAAEAELRLPFDYAPAAETEANRDRHRGCNDDSACHVERPPAQIEKIPAGTPQTGAVEQVDEQTIAVLSRLVPHLSCAMRLAARFNALTLGCRVMENVADQLLFGVYVLDAAGTVLHHNTAARKVAAANDGLRIEAQRLRFSSIKVQRCYEAALAAATGECNEAQAGPADVITLLRPSGRRPYTLRVFPVLAAAPSPTQQRAVAAAFVTDPERMSQPDSKVLADALGLTPREADLALQLAAGYSVADSAEHLGITPATARSYLKLIFRKTRVNRQGELVRLVLSTVMALPENRALQAAGCPVLQ